MALRVIKGVNNRRNGWKPSIGYPESSDGGQKHGNPSNLIATINRRPIEGLTASMAKWAQ